MKYIFNKNFQFSIDEPTDGMYDKNINRPTVGLQI
jgi:hypothetical protein